MRHDTTLGSFPFPTTLKTVFSEAAILSIHSRFLIGNRDNIDALLDVIVNLVVHILSLLFSLYIRSECTFFTVDSFSRQISNQHYDITFRITVSTRQCDTGEIA